MINGLYIMIVLGLSITCIGLMIQSTLFQWMNVSKELLPGALSYDSIIFIGLCLVHFIIMNLPF